MFEMEDSEHFEEDVLDDTLVVVKVDTSESCDRITDTNFQSLKTNYPVIDASKEDFILKNILVEAVEQQTPNDRVKSLSVNISDNKMETDLLLSKVQKLEARKHVWSTNGVRKSKSPCLPVILGKATTDAIVDEGSEINCLDEGFAVRNSINYVLT